MRPAFRVRLIQASMGLGYCVVLVGAIAKAPEAGSVAIAAALLALSYVTGEVVPDAYVSPDHLLRVCGVGLAVLPVGVFAVLSGGRDTLGWATAVMAFCAGNRFKAAGLGPSGR
jgi:hypothetical protein